MRVLALLIYAAYIRVCECGMRSRTCRCNAVRSDIVEEKKTGKHRLIRTLEHTRRLVDYNTAQQKTKNKQMRCINLEYLPMHARHNAYLRRCTSTMIIIIITDLYNFIYERIKKDVQTCVRCFIS